MQAGAVPVSRSGQTAWPRDWDHILAGWNEGVTYRMDWGGSSFGGRRFHEDVGKSVIGERPTLQSPAMIGPDRAGRLLAFSSRAVLAAVQAWRHFDLQRMVSPVWHVAWLNGISDAGLVGFRSPSGVPGFDAMDVGTADILFCAEVLGPVGRLTGHAKEGGRPRFWASPGLSVRVDPEGIFVRGAALADGWWHNGAVQPLKGGGGWLKISRYTIKWEA